MLLLQVLKWMRLKEQTGKIKGCVLKAQTEKKVKVKPKYDSELNKCWCSNGVWEKRN